MSSGVIIQLQGLFSLFPESSSSSSSDKSRNLKGAISKYLCGVNSHTQVNEWSKQGKTQTDMVQTLYTVCLHNTLLTISTSKILLFTTLFIEDF